MSPLIGRLFPSTSRLEKTWCFLGRSLLVVPIMDEAITRRDLAVVKSRTTVRGRVHMLDTSIIFRWRDRRGLSFRSGFLGVREPGFFIGDCLAVLNRPSLVISADAGP